jgi:hypothetical protein
MAKQWTRRQQDLFEEPPPSVRLGPAERITALEQLQALLMEAIAIEADRLEVDNDEDHA